MTEREALTKIHNKIAKCLNKAVKTFPELKDAPELKYDVALTGRCGGKHIYNTLTNEHRVSINRVLLNENEETVLNQTVPHEVAHYIVTVRYGYERDFRGRRIVKPHGKEWKMVMGVLGVPAKRCHNMDTTNAVTRKLKRFEYKCDCDTKHVLTSIRHNRIQRGQYTLSCKKCKGKLVYKGATGQPVAQPVKPVQPKKSLGDFTKGQPVKFEATRGRILDGEVVRINKKTVTIDAGENGKWRVSPGYIIK